MSGDLVSLRMLSVGATPAYEDWWRAGATLASIPIEFEAGSASAAKIALGRGGIDFCVLDAGLNDVERAAVIEAARANRPATLVFASTRPGSARPDRTDGVLAVPANGDEARKLIEICVHTKISTRVLIVDDSHAQNRAKVLAASRFAFDVHEAAEGIGALEQIGSGNFGLVFFDYNMPGFNGIEALSEMKRVAPQVSVAMMTSAANSEIIDRAASLGALAFLKKPFYPADIDTVLKRHYGLNAV